MVDSQRWSIHSDVRQVPLPMKAIAAAGEGFPRAAPLRPERNSLSAFAVATGVAALPFLAVLILPSLLYTLIPRATYLTFHNVAEFFSAMVLFSVFGVGWFTHTQSKDRRSLFFACAFLAIGILGVMHLLSFSGMPDFVTANSPTKASQYWIVLRFLTAVTFLASAFVSAETPRWLSKRTLLPPSLALPGVAFALISFFPELVPVTYDPVRGLTPFKVHAEYLIVALFLLTVPIYLLRGRRTRTPPSNRILLAIVLSAYAELVFTTYHSVFDTYNALGHVYYFAAACLVYQEVFARSVREPYEALTAERSALEREIAERQRAEEALRASEQKLSLHRDHLEELVGKRTAELSTAKEAAEKANRAKSVFLANMSHELRTPLNAVLGFSHLMRNAPDTTAGQRESLDIITHSGEYLLSLINNVLDISKIESGRIELEESPLDPRQLVQSVTSLMYVRAREKNLSFMLEQAPDLPQCIAADAAKLRQVLFNLVGNAIKYTTRGGVTLRIRATGGEAAGRVGLLFEVADTGPGIPPEQRNRIFSPFVQLGNRPATEAGSGLGLAICRQFVELMGGEIGVAAGPGGGSVFSFEIPVRVVATEAVLGAFPSIRVVGIAEGEPRYRLLIVEDQPENRHLLRRLLEPVGFELREAADGAEAVTQWEEWRPHLIFMDIRMPVMDGLQATRRIRAADVSDGTRIVAITAHALEEERRMILAAGCDDFVRKPYQDTEVFETLTTHLGVHFTYEETAPGPGAGTFMQVADLASLPEKLLKGLEQALVQIDINAVDRMIADIGTYNPEVAGSLAAVARDLQFERILWLVRSARARELRREGAPGAKK
jgi:signal transduction histidine kinase/ActR/RegA family two-component response regulator